MRLLTLATSTGLLVLASLLTPTLTGQGNSPVLNLQVSDCWGQPIPTETKVTVLGTGDFPTKEWHLYPETRTLPLPPRRYSVLIEAVGFETWSTELDLYRGTRNLRACLTVGSVTGYSARANLTGKLVQSADQPVAEEVRLLGVYSEVSATAIPDENGAFAFTGIQPGHYIVLVLAKSKILVTKQVDVRVASPPFEVSY